MFVSQVQVQVDMSASSKHHLVDNQLHHQEIHQNLKMIQLFILHQVHHRNL